MGKKNKDGAASMAEESEMNMEEQTRAGQEETAAADSDARQTGRDYEAELAAEKDRYLRLAAEYDNYRRRSQKEREALFVDVKAETIKALLPVFDNLERALAAECSDGAFYKGVEMTMTQLTDIFEKLGVTAIEAENQPFDPQVHNAVIHVEDETAGENMIVEQFQRGFKLNDKVIRFAMVKVAN